MTSQTTDQWQIYIKFLLSSILQLRDLADSNDGSKIKETTSGCISNGIETVK